LSFFGQKLKKKTFSEFLIFLKKSQTLFFLFCRRDAEIGHGLSCLVLRPVGLDQKKKSEFIFFPKNQAKQAKPSQADIKMKWIKIFIPTLPKPKPTPLGRWSQCGEKKTINDILEFKARQKARRLYFLETGTDPYHASSVHPLPPEKRVKTEEEYMRPFVIQS